MLIKQKFNSKGRKKKTFNLIIMQKNNNNKKTLTISHQTFI